MQNKIFILYHICIQDKDYVWNWNIRVIYSLCIYLVIADASFVDEVVLLYFYLYRSNELSSPFNHFVLMLYCYATVHVRWMIGAFKRVYHHHINFPDSINAVCCCVTFFVHYFLHKLGH